MTRCGKSCSAFSNSMRESEISVEKNEVSACPSGIAVYTSRWSTTEISRNSPSASPPSTVRLMPSITPPAGSIQISMLCTAPTISLQKPESHAARCNSAASWAASWARREEAARSTSPTVTKSDPCRTNVILAAMPVPAVPVLSTSTRPFLSGPRAIPRDRCCDGLAQRRGAHAEGLLEGSAVGDEGFREFVHHLDHLARTR